MGRLFVITLEGNIYSCKHCNTHFALADHIISKMRLPSQLLSFGPTLTFQLSGSPSTYPITISARKLGLPEGFQSKHGKAYLFHRVVNVTVGEKEERMMLTGMHTVVDIFCVGCGSIVGWKYEAAEEKSQKYKEGKFILERFKVLGPDGSSYSPSQDAQLGGSDTDEPE